MDEIGNMWKNGKVPTNDDGEKDVSHAAGGRLVKNRSTLESDSAHT